MKKLLVILAIILIPQIAFAAWVATDNFDSYVAGASINGVNGGSGWTGAWSIAIGTVTTPAAPAGMSGNAALALGNSVSEATRTFTATNSGTVSFQARVTSTSCDPDNCRVTFRDSGAATTRFYITFEGGNIRAKGSAANTLQAYAANTTYRIQIDFTSTQFTVSIDGGAASGPFNCNGGSCNVNLFLIDAVNGTNVDLYVDDIKTVAAAAATPTSLIGLIRSFWID